MASTKKTLDLVVTFLAQTKGREKSIRFFQYFARVIKCALEVIAERKVDKELLKLAATFNDLGTNLALTRKVLRFGNLIRLYASIKGHLKEYSSGKISSEDQFKCSKNTAGFICRVFSEVSLSLYFLLDHIVYFHKIGFVKNKELARKCDTVGSWCWFGEVLGSVLSEGIEIYLQKQRIINEAKNSNPEEGQKAITEAKKKIDAATYNFIMSFLDFPATVYFATEGKYFRLGFISVLTSISSLMGAYTAWPK